MSAQPIEMPEPKCDPGKEKVFGSVLAKTGTQRVEPDLHHNQSLEDERVVWRAEKVSLHICFCEETPFEAFHFHPCLPASGGIRKVLWAENTSIP